MTEENKNAGEQPQTAPQSAPEAKAQPSEMPAGFKFLIGRKMGMTQMFDAAGELFAVSVIQAGPCRVIYTRTPEKDGYKAVCLGFGHMTEKNVNAARMGIFKKLDMKPVRKFKEFRVDDISGVQEGQVASLTARFAAGEYVDLQGVSKGKGFAGVMKRHHFKGGRATHGSMFHRAPGSIGGSSYPSRVWPGMRMGGHMGSEQVTVRNLEIAKVDAENNLLLIKGAVPGPKGGYVVIKQEA